MRLAVDNVKISDLLDRFINNLQIFSKFLERFSLKDFT